MNQKYFSQVIEKRQQKEREMRALIGLGGHSVKVLIEGKTKLTDRTTRLAEVDGIDIHTKTATVTYTNGEVENNVAWFRISRYEEDCY